MALEYDDDEDIDEAHETLEWTIPWRWLWRLKKMMMNGRHWSIWAIPFSSMRRRGRAVEEVEDEEFA